MEPQSGVERFSVTMNEPSSNQTAQNVSFNDMNPAHSYDVDSMPDPSFGVADSNDADLGNFFSRPVKIKSLVWGVNSTFFEAFDPWSLYFENLRVINRLSNFNLLRAKLHVRFLVNGNSFYFGRCLASYTPLKDTDDISLDRAFIAQDVISASQKPHLYLDPCTSQGGDMTLPYFWYKNCLQIPTGEWNRMGEMILHAINFLQHANGDTTPINVSVFAWAEDVNLAIPTSADAATLSAQSGSEVFQPQSGNDEYTESHTGPISKPASVIAKVAGKLENVPYIGPYARATGMAASATADVASLYGYSRPSDITGIASYKPVYGGNMANTNVPDTSLRLTVDAKQEITIDPRTCGLGDKDEMSIQSIVTRESYLTTFNWLIANNSEDLLFSAKVTPMMFDVVSAASPEYHMTPMCWAAMPFNNWRGTIKYRFQVVSSGFHKGRLKFVYEPNQSAGNEYNTNYTHIVDIAECKDFTVGAGWGQTTSFLRTQMPASSDLPFGTGQQNPNLLFANGTLNVYVVNKLTSPNSVAENDIKVNVIVSAGDDFELANPDDEGIEQFGYFRPQSGTETLMETMIEGSAPIDEEVESTLASSITDDPAMSVYFGEVYTSFRALLKRYCFHTAYGSSVPGTSQSVNLVVTTSAFPHYRGAAPGAVDFVPGVFAYNRSKTTMLNWLTPAYAAYRGGVRWKFIPLSNPRALASMRVARHVDPNGFSTYASFLSLKKVNSITSTIRESFLQNMSTGFSGMAVTSGEDNSVLEIESPFMSQFRFYPARWMNKTTSSEFNQWLRLHAHYTSHGGENQNLVVGSYCAAAEDFSLFFFLAVPISYKIGATDPGVP